MDRGDDLVSPVSRHSGAHSKLIEYWMSNVIEKIKNKDV